MHQRTCAAAFDAVCAMGADRFVSRCFSPMAGRAPVRFPMGRKHTCVGLRSLGLRRFKLDGLRFCASIIR
jgi:hypothetical protein